MPSTGYFVIADISGYTRFLGGTELEHAQGILEGLFNALLDNLKSPLKLSNLQGDALLAIGPDTSAPAGPIVVAAVERLYCAFSDALRRMRMNTTCACAACANMASLDLKLIVHHGTFVETTIAGRTEIAGSDVILAHRLLKNRVIEATGITAYAAYSEAALARLDMPAFATALENHIESTTDLGDVRLGIQDLTAVWKAHLSATRVVVEFDEPKWMAEKTTLLPVPPDRAWDYLTNPAYRQRAIPGVDSIKQERMNGGRAGSGTIDHCAHGKQVLVFETIDWRPFEYFTRELALPMGGRLRETMFFTPEAGGTRVTSRMRMPVTGNGFTTWLLGKMTRRVVQQVSLDYDKMFRTLLDIAAEETRAHRTEVEAAAPTVDRDAFVRQHSHAE
jgi:hypothetical protein